MHYLVGTASVHTTAAICDYLDERATADDTVTVIAVAPLDNPTARQDAQEALNVASVRLTTVGDVQTELRETDGDDTPADRFLEAATAADADEILLTPQSGTRDPSTASESTAQTLIDAASLPVVVVPAPDL